jgi:hypothetical protein
MFVAGRPFQPSLILAGKASILPYSGAPERVIHSRKLRPYKQTFDEARKACQGQTLDHYEDLSITAVKFITLCPGVCVIKLFTTVINPVPYKVSAWRSPPS